MREAVSAFHVFKDSRKAVCLVDCESTILSCNPMMTQLVGKPAEDISGKRCKELLNCEHSSTHHCILDKISHTRQKEHTFCRFEDQWVETILDPLFSNDNECQGAILSFSLVEDPSDGMQKLLKAQRYESIAVKAAGIAHDFNNVFTILGAHTAILKNALSGDTGKSSSLEVMQTAMDRAKELTKQLLNVGKPEELSENPIDLRECIRDSVNFSVIGSNAKLMLHIPDNLWPVHANLDQIKQLVCNLTINATQAITNGHGVIEIEAKNISARKAENLMLKPGKYVCLQFKDNGHGISKEHIDSIFNPYYTTREDGTGLGLSTVSFIARQHKGCINVESAPDRGTTFAVYLFAGE